MCVSISKIQREVNKSRKSVLKIISDCKKMPKHKMSSAKKDFKTEIYFSMRKKDGEKIYDVP